MKVLAIIPTYNECRNIPVLIERINAAVRDHALDILVVDDNSPDGTAACVRGLQQAHPNVTLRTCLLEQMHGYQSTACHE